MTGEMDGRAGRDRAAMGEATSGAGQHGSDSDSGALERSFATWTPPWARTPDGAGQPDDRPEPEPEPEPEIVDADRRSGPPSPVAEPEPAAGSAEPVAATGGPPVPNETDVPVLQDPVTLRTAVEAILMVVDEPVPDILLAQTLEQPVERIRAAVQELADDYTRQQRGFELRRAAGGWRIYTRAEYAPYVERFVLDGQQVRLTQAALETLAVVAYKQPVTRGRVSAIRGVNCDGVFRTLVTRGLVEECGAEPDSGAYLYRTTVLFLERMGIDSVAELPELAPFLPDDLPEEA